MGGTDHVKYLIIGAGPAGLQMAYFLQSRDRDYVVLERAEHAGSFFETFPRNRRLISLNKRHNFFPETEFNWRHDWNSLLSDDPELRMTNYSEEVYPHADDLVRYFRDFADRFDLNIRYGTEVTHVESTDTGAEVTIADGSTITCEVLLVGTGAATERTPREIAGADSDDLQTYGNHDQDLERYRNKRVAVIGQGNSAFETAQYLQDVAAWVHVFGKHPFKLAWDTHFVGNVRSVNNDVLDLFHFKALRAYLTRRLRSITSIQPGFRTEHEYDYPDSDPPGTLCLTRDYDEVIVCTGWNFVPSDLFDEDSAPATWYDGKFPEMHGDWESVNTPGCHFIGAAMQGNDRTSASGFIHGFRYNIRTLWHLLEERHEGVPYPGEDLGEFDWPSLEERFYQRVSVSAAMYQQYGTLGDVIAVDRTTGRVRWYDELPVKHLGARDFGDSDVFVVTMEYGFHKHDAPALSFTGPSDPNDPARAVFLHPIIRRLRDGELDRDEAAEFHFGDSLLGRWDLPHATGGAVLPYHRDFAVWFHKEIGRTAPQLPEPEGSSAYRVWSDEEIAGHRADMSATP